MNWKSLCLIIGITLAISNIVFAQGSPQQGGSNQGVIEIEAQVIDARVELPQVQILDKSLTLWYYEVSREVRAITKPEVGQSAKAKTCA